MLEPIQQLTHNDIEWQWRREHQAAFEKVKALVTSAPLLKNYNPETHYAQIEKEMLAVVFALSKFDQYDYGRPVTVQVTTSHCLRLPVNP